MKVPKSLLIVGAVASVSLASVTGLKVASAQTSSSSTGVSSLVDKLATKFNLKKADVQAVFDEDKAARQADRQQEISDNLQKAVDSGKLTAAQKTLIENKLKELQAARDTERTALEAWADQNGIDLKYLMMGGRHDNDSDDDLQAAVTAGKITAAQKTLIENKRQEIQAAREAERIALQKWATDNNIDLSYLRGEGRGHGPMMRGGPGGPF